MSEDITLHVNLDDLDETFSRLFFKLPKEVKVDLVKGIHKMIRSVLIGRAPYKQGGLRGSIQTEPLGRDEWITGPTKKVQGYDLGTLIVRGVRAREIRPRRRKALRFYWRGSWHFRKRVNWPGAKANPFHVKAKDDLIPLLRKCLRETWLDHLRRLR